MKRFFVGLAVTGGMLLGSAFTAPRTLAGGNGAITFTQTFHDATQVLLPGAPDYASNPCTGVPGTLTLTYNGVFHGTINSTGSWFTGTTTGTFVFVPVDPAQPTYTGHFTDWFGDENNLQNSVEHATFSVHGIGSDGSTLIFHETAHASISASGITVTFDRPRCG